MPSDPRELQHAIAHHVAAALEKGGITWQMSAPLLGDYIGDDLVHGPPVAAARALGQALTRQATAVQSSLSNGDRTSAANLVAQLQNTERRLAAVRDATSALPPSDATALAGVDGSGCVGLVVELCHPQ